MPTPRPERERKIKKSEAVKKSPLLHDAHKNMVKNQELFLKAYPKFQMNITKTAEAIGITRQCVQTWRVNFPEFAARLEEIREIENEARLDWAENILHDRMEQGSDMLIKFFLESKGKSRGYGKEQKVELSGNLEGVQLVVNFGDDDDDEENIFDGFVDDSTTATDD